MPERAESPGRFCSSSEDRATDERGTRNLILAEGILLRKPMLPDEEWVETAAILRD